MKWLKASYFRKSPYFRVIQLAELREDTAQFVDVVNVLDGACVGSNAHVAIESLRHFEHALG